MTPFVSLQCVVLGRLVMFLYQSLNFFSHYPTPLSLIEIRYDTFKGSKLLFKFIVYCEIFLLKKSFDN